MIVVHCHRSEGLTLTLHQGIKQPDETELMAPTNERLALKGGRNQIEGDDEKFWAKWTGQNKQLLEGHSLLSLEPAPRATQPAGTPAPAEGAKEE